MLNYTDTPISDGYGTMLVLGDVGGDRFMQIIFHSTGKIYKRFKRSTLENWFE